jgi:hypothetical protein
MDQQLQNSHIFSQIHEYRLVFMRVIFIEYGVDFCRRKK